MTPQLAWTGFRELAYTTIKDRAKADRWLIRRAEYLRENQPGLVQDAEIMYGMLMEYFIDQYGVMNARDISGIVAQIIKLQELVLTHRPVEDQMDQRDLIGRDELLDVMSKYTAPDEADLLENAMEVMAEETPA